MVYLPTFTINLKANVDLDKYTSPMEHMGYVDIPPI